MVLHSCDRPFCVNPAHLSLGDATKNGREMALRGRQTFQKNPSLVMRGTQNPAAKITASDVLYIRAEKRSRADRIQIARDLGITEATLNRIIARKGWSHI